MYIKLSISYNEDHVSILTFLTSQLYNSQCKYKLELSLTLFSYKYIYIFFTANEFPSSFESLVKKIVRLLFHVVAHMYHSHFKEIVLLNLHAHLNSVFVHLILFNERFHLIDEKETEILQDLAAALRIHADAEADPASGGSSSGTTATSTSKENNNFLSAEGESVGKSVSDPETASSSHSSSRDVSSTPTRMEHSTQQPQGEGGGGGSAVASG